MSHEAVTWAQEHAPMLLTEKGKPATTARHVLGVLAEFARRDGTNAHPSLARLQYRTGFNRRTIQRSLDLLEDGTLIEQTGTTDGGVPIWKLAMHLRRPASDWEEILADLDRERAAMAGRQKRSRARRVTDAECVTDADVTDSASGCHALEQRDVTDAECVNHVRKTAVTVIEPSVDPSKNKEDVVDVRRTTDGGSARAADDSGSAATEPTSPLAADSGDTTGRKPSPFPAEVRRLIRNTEALLPAALLAVLWEKFPYRHLPNENRKVTALALESRTPAQLGERAAWRWVHHGYERDFHDGLLRSPLGVVEELLRPTPNCPDRACEDGVLIDTGEACRSCQQRIADRVRDRRAGRKVRTGRETRLYRDREQCEVCDRPFTAGSDVPADKVCGGCRAELDRAAAHAAPAPAGEPAEDAHGPAVPVAPADRFETAETVVWQPAPGASLWTDGGPADADVPALVAVCSDRLPVVVPDPGPQLWPEDAVTPQAPSPEPENVAAVILFGRTAPAQEPAAAPLPAPRAEPTQAPLMLPLDGGGEGGAAPNDWHPRATPARPAEDQSGKTRQTVSSS
ncbi:helix-turn-helix domain-containing protein [Kitasatospora sp. NPDC101447]|uniref:helix-turn-helix domain-containing protein n=1 Tax=Kitasatospora sp. NPDC101447 TaxID=3364102 RepID=UPI0037F48A0A